MVGILRSLLLGGLLLKRGGVDGCGEIGDGVWPLLLLLLLAEVVGCALFGKGGERWRFREGGRGLLWAIRGKRVV